MTERKGTEDEKQNEVKKEIKKTEADEKT